MAKNKIGWCSSTYNPIIGCKNGCWYCYAANQAKRFKKMFGDFTVPHLSLRGFDIHLPKEPQRIFVGSMSDVAFWERDWVYKMLEVIRFNPQHCWMFLTKDPTCEAYHILAYYATEYNIWLGVTATNQEEYNERWKELVFGMDESITKFVSFEPLFGEIRLELEQTALVSNNPVYKKIPCPDWIIIGKLTGPKSKTTPWDNFWAEWLVIESDELHIPCYLKGNLPSEVSYEVETPFPKGMPITKAEGRTGTDRDKQKKERQDD